jgi:uncharacterized protein YprB with RNaseH-like and TPR domain
VDQVSLKEYVEKIIEARLCGHDKIHDAERRAIDLATSDLKAWKNAHNDLQRQIRDAQNATITRADLEQVEKRVNVIERLVYIGLGLMIAVQIVLGWIHKT